MFEVVAKAQETLDGLESCAPRIEDPDRNSPGGLQLFNQYPCGFAGVWQVAEGTGEARQVFGN